MLKQLEESMLDFLDIFEGIDQIADSQVPENRKNECKKLLEQKKNRLENTNMEGKINK